MHSQRFGVGVFFLLMLGSCCFPAIIVAVCSETRASAGHAHRREGDVRGDHLRGGRRGGVCFLANVVGRTFLTCRWHRVEVDEWIILNLSVTAGASTSGCSSAHRSSWSVSLAIRWAWRNEQFDEDIKYLVFTESDKDKMRPRSTGTAGGAGGADGEPRTAPSVASGVAPPRHEAGRSSDTGDHRSGRCRVMSRNP